MPTELLTWGREVLARQPFSVMLGAQLDAFEPGSAQLSVPMSHGLLQQAQAVCRCDIFLEQGGERKLCAAAQGMIRRAE